METLAYLHLAHNYELPAADQPQLQVETLFTGSQLGRSLLGLLVPVVIGLSVPAIAQAQVLQMGNEGASVSEVQSDLQRLGYPIDVDGVYGDGTTDIVEQFQSESGLTIDGQVGPETRQALDQALRQRNAGAAGSSAYPSAPAQTSTSTGSGPLLRRGDTGTDVRRLQQRLCNRRYRCAVNGVFDQQTEQAVIQLQRDQRLEPDGIVGANTWTALGGVQGGPSPTLRQYIVLIPMDTGVKLADVRRWEYGASEQRGSRLGAYIQVATYRDRGLANQKMKDLRSQGFDAQVRRL
jgi:peptidoglycan hydrolase-like protein with peptidoglycan-binding domain